MTTPRSPVTAPQVARTKVRHGAAPLVMVTAYEASAARIADRAGVDLILVGDSLGMVVQGGADTLRVTVDDVVYHSRCVTSAKPSALVVADMPWLSYHVSAEDAVRNAGRLVREGGAGAVKLEGGRKRLAVASAIHDAEIPVVGHLGLTPQSIHAMGGYKVQAKDPAAAEALLEDALALEDAGIFALVLECVPADVAARVTERLSVPTIGIGAGSACDGQVLVWHDLLGLGQGPLPRFVRQYADLGAAAEDAVRRYCDDVRAGSFPSDAESYHATATAAATATSASPSRKS
jgi:3-methyl-2-oxobutanoate hydroxymethyltransferase